MWKEFKQFLFKGSVVDLAVAVVMGAAFGAVVTALVANILTPLIAAIAGKPDFSALGWTLNHSRILYGTFINALIAFILIGVAVYFFVVVPVNAYLRRSHGAQSVEPPKTRSCPECLSDINIDARRCAFCGQPVK